MDFLDASLAIKLVATAAVVLSATLIAERAGAFIAAMIAALPISAGPAYVFIAMEHDAAFVAQSALTSLSANAMIAPFLLIGAALINRIGTALSLAIALSAWIAGAIVVLRAPPSIPAAVAINVALFAVCLLLSRPYRKTAIATAARRGLIDIALRVVAVVCVVAGVIIGGRAFGAEVAGIAAIFPVVWVSMTVIVSTRLGRPACAAVLANGLIGMVGFAAALATIYLSAPRLGSVVALSLALGVCVSWNLGLSFAHRRAARHRAAMPEG